MATYVKNTSGAQGTWLGKVIENNAYYEIPEVDKATWASNSGVLVDIASGDLTVSKDDSGNNDITDVNISINYLKNLPSDMDVTGRPIVRYAATVKGWHYQAHSVQFEVNKLNSIYNKDDEGNDLGFTSLKVYDDQGDECVDQATADTDGVKTVVTWAPDFDFEIISGNIRQLEKETVDSYMYVNAMVATGLAAPNDWLKIPFAQGGVNLKYIGADEQLKTDGRASKLLQAGTNGDYFQIIVNYDADLLTNTNRHKMSVIFEIYKSPT